jgi:hypothetical protein
MPKHPLLITLACFLTTHLAFARLVQIPTYDPTTPPARLCP